MSDFATRIPLVTSYDYVQDTEPLDVDVGEAWWDTVNSVGQVWTGSSWDEESAPQPGTALELVAGEYNVTGVSPDELTFVPVTDTDLSNHAGDASAHHSPPEAAWSVIDSKTYDGASTPVSLDVSGLSHEEYKLRFLDVTDSNTGYIKLVLNGNTNSDYIYRLSDGSKANTGGPPPLAATEDGGAGEVIVYRPQNQYQRPKFHNRAAGFPIATTIHGKKEFGNSELTSIGLTSDGSLSGTLTLLGRSL